MFKLLLIGLIVFYSIIILYLLYKINGIRKELNIIKSRVSNIENSSNKIPAKQTGFGTGKAKDEHTSNDHDIYHY